MSKRLNTEKYSTWKWCIVVFIIIPPMIAILSPTGILRIIIVNISNLIEWIDDVIHAIILPPFKKAEKWSQNK